MLFLRLIICRIFFGSAFQILGMGGNISDWYRDEEILMLVQKSFICNDGPWLVFAIVALFAFIDICRLFWNYISYYLLERRHRLSACRCYKITWSIIMCGCLVVMITAYHTLRPYSDAVITIAQTKSLDEVDQALNEEEALIIYITRRGCNWCADTTQQLLNILPETEYVNLIHYDTAKDRVSQADRMYDMLDRLSVDSVPAIVLFKEGKVENLLDGKMDDEKLKEMLIDFTE